MAATVVAECCSSFCRWCDPGLVPMAKHYLAGSRSWRLAGRLFPVVVEPRRQMTGTLTTIGLTMVGPGWWDQEQHLQYLNYANYPLNLMDDSTFCAGHAQLFHERANGKKTSLNKVIRRKINEHLPWSKSLLWSWGEVAVVGCWWAWDG